MNHCRFVRGSALNWFNRIQKLPLKVSKLLRSISFLVRNGNQKTDSVRNDVSVLE